MTDRPDDPRRSDLERVRAHLDLAEGRAPVALLSDADVLDVLGAARRIAVVGASSKPWRPSFGVMRYLLDAGYDCVPVNPDEHEVLGVPSFPTLRAAHEGTGPFDIVDVFRRPEACPAHAEEAVAVGAKCLWLQLGVVSWAAARIAAAAGLGVVMDRCTEIEHRRLEATRRRSSG